MSGYSGYSNFLIFTQTLFLIESITERDEWHESVFVEFPLKYRSFRQMRKGINFRRKGAAVRSLRALKAEWASALWLIFTQKDDRTSVISQVCSYKKNLTKNWFNIIIQHLSEILCSMTYYALIQYILWRFRCRRSKINATCNVTAELF